MVSTEDSNGSEIYDVNVQDFDVDDECEDHEEVAGDDSVLDFLNDEWE